MSNTIVKSNSVNRIDCRADKMQPYFGADLGITDPYWHVVECEESLGSQPGFARIIIPNTAGQVDETCFSVAFNPDGPRNLIKHGCPVAVKIRSTNPASGQITSSLLWVGKVEDIQDHPETNSMEVVAYDSRVDLKDIRVFGRYIYNPVTGTVQYQQGWPSHFNPKGRPNRIYTPGGTPCFAPYPDYGLSTDQAPLDPTNPASNDSKTTVAGYWSLADELQHVWAFYGNATPDDNLVVAARNAASAAFSYIKRFPPSVDWQRGFGSSIDDISKANFNNAVGQNNTIQGGMRKGRDLNVRGLSFVGDGGIFDLIFKTAGAWSWYTATYGENGANLLHGMRAVSTRWIGGGVDIPIAIGGAAKNVMKTPVITHSDYKESSKNTISSAVVHGSLIKIETRCSTRAADHGGTTPALIPAWSQADQDAFCTAVVTATTAAGLSRPNADMFAIAASQYWWVLTTWVLNPAFDFQAGTSESGKPRASVTRQLWPTLLSFAGNVTQANDITPYPVRFEVTSDGTHWTLGPEADGFELRDNGIIFVPGLRDVVINSHNTSTGSFRWNGGVEYAVAGGKLDIILNDIRASIAIPCDHRLEYAVQTFPSAVASGSVTPIMDDSPHVDRIDSSFSRMKMIDLNGLYECWLRINSYPLPNFPKFPDLADSTRSTGALRTDLGADGEPPDMLMGHGNRTLIDGFSLSCEGGWEFGGVLADIYPLGTSVNNLIPVGSGARSPIPVKRVIAKRRWTSRATKDEERRDIFINTTKIFPC